MAFDSLFSLCTVCSVLCDVDSLICVYCKKWFHVNVQVYVHQSHNCWTIVMLHTTAQCVQNLIMQQFHITSTPMTFYLMSSPVIVDTMLETSNIFQSCYKNALSIVHINIRSLAKNLPLLEAFIYQLNHSPDIIAISETKLRSTTPANFGYNVNIYGYKFVHADTETNAGGVGFYVKEGVDFNMLPNFGIDISDCESLWIEVKLHNTNCAIGVVYRHAAPNHKEFD